MRRGNGQGFPWPVARPLSPLDDHFTRHHPCTTFGTVCIWLRRSSGAALLNPEGHAWRADAKRGFKVTDPDGREPDEVPTFVKGLPENIRLALLRLGRPTFHRRGTVLLGPRYEGRNVFLIASGWVKILAMARGGEETLLAIRGPGDVIGELSAIDGRPRSAVVEAFADVEAIEISGRTFLEETVHTPELSLALLRHLAAHLRESDLRRVEFISSDTFGRLVVHLLELAAEHGEGDAAGQIVLRLPLTQTDLAGRSAMSREAVARGLRKLRERDLVRTGRRGIVIVRPEQLRLLAPQDAR